ncbi:cilia- and flagella-associated protein 206 [Cryptotermes secundus]|nr:cilia- and flagella-associated protein 206 [Cryptotermes secundus]XP_033608370.1 cilia- and flagella-associated protein 206 [Cryptotermes secundus]
MLKAIETENVTKNIIREITRECASRGINITDNCAAYVIKLMVLNPEHGFISDRPLARDDVQLLVDVCVQKLSEECSPSLATIQMQVYFDTNFATRHDIINENRANIKLRTMPLIKEIIETHAKTKEDLEKLYRKIVVTTATSSGLGNPTNSSILREARAVLSSVFPHTELSQFMAMSRKYKEQQITELTLITTGIRLFNRDCQKGGEGIEDLPNLLQKAVVATQSSLESQLQKLLGRVNVLTTAVEKCVRIPDKPKHMYRVQEVEEEAVGEKTEKEGDKDQAEKLHKIPKKQMQMVWDGLTTARQLEVYLRKLLMEVVTSKQVLAELLDKLKLRLTNIHETVRFRTAIPTIQVYPQFIHLSQIWTSLQEEMVFLSNINNLAWNLQKYLQVLEYTDEGVVKQMIGNTQVLTDEARLKATTGLKIDSTGIKCEVLYPAQVTDFDKIPLQYLGFCAWSLVEGLGALIPGNPNMGVCQWKGNYYAFSSPVTAAEFGQDPDKYVMSLLNLMKKKPELINLLQLQEQVAAGCVTAELPIKKPEPIIKRNSEIQTEVHPTPSHIDPTYRWNEWDLKRDAIKLANILKCKTKSVQTEPSYQKMTIGLQAKPSKSQEVQTIQDRKFNIPELQMFI